MESVSNENELNPSGPTKVPSHRFWIVAPLMLAACIAFSGWWVVKSTERTLKTNLAVKLKTVARVESEAVAAWMESKKQAFRILARRASFAQTTSPKDVTEFANLYLSPLADNLGAAHFDLISTAGQKIYSTRRIDSTDWIQESSVLSDLSSEPKITFVPQKNTGSKKLSEQRSRDKSFLPSMRMVLVGRWKANPKRNSKIAADSQRSVADEDARQNKKHSHGGVLVVEFSILDELTQIVRSSRMGKSGETLVYDRSGNLLSLSRFMIDSFDNELVDRMVAQESVKQFDLTGFRDSRGKRVVGAAEWNPILGVGLVTKIDYDEAIAPIVHVKRFIVILCVLLFVGAISLLLYQYWLARKNQLQRQKELQKRKLGMYQLEERIGEGGMGIVFRAQHQLLTRPTAIKILSPAKSSPRSVKRFEREVQFTSQLKNPNTISIYDYGRTDHGLFYYAMEYVDGLTLDQLVTSDGCQTDGRAIHILVQICDSLIEAHACGLIHRDIKPSNVMVCDMGCVPDHVKVLDFGMVREFADSANGKIGLSGTPHYMPPEALTRKHLIDHRFDIFSIGAVGYFLLTGRHFRESKNLNQIIEQCDRWTEEKIKEKLQRFAEETQTKISEQLIQIISQSAAPEPQDRIPSIVELKKQLLQCQAYSPWDEESAKNWWVARPNIQPSNDQRLNDFDDSPIPVLSSVNSWSMPTITLEESPEESEPVCS